MIWQSFSFLNQNKSTDFLKQVTHSKDVEGSSHEKNGKS